GILKEFSQKSIVVEYMVREDMSNPAGTLHGGMSALIMDEIIGFHNFCLRNDNLYTSVNLNVDFLAPAIIGEKITAYSKIIRKGRQLNHFECTITNSKGKLVAKGSSNLICTPFKLKDVIQK
ncbi:PaaI family thioesterase, partial [Xanthovirga aplysinae]|uniref:PaaI family thioesterase n=1 Tax=Xanthovirga aplysinae TaxID=2529853 RepID=UPI0012BCEF31